MTNQRDAAEAVVDRLMIDFYTSPSYDPKAARPGDVVKAAIAFTLASMPAASNERPDIDACVRRIADQHRIDNRSWLRKEIERIAAPAASEGDSSEERRHVEMQRLQEIADGAYGDGPMTRGAARDQLAAMTAASEWEPVAKEITDADKRAAARYLCSQAFGKPVADILADWAKLEAEPEGYCHPLWIVMRDHRLAHPAPSDQEKPASHQVADLLDEFSAMDARDKLVGELVEALEQIELLSCNQGGWFEQDPFGEYTRLGRIAGKTLGITRARQNGS